MRVLVVDDDALLLRALCRVLADNGIEPVGAPSGPEGVALLRQRPIDVIVSDISMPGMGGIEFLREVRKHDLDVPVILMTGNPALTTAIQAVEYGAFGYLLKPIEGATLAAMLGRAHRLHAMARLKRRALALAGRTGRELGDRASLEARFAHALETLWIAYHPIVSWAERRVFSYEALVRSDESTLAHPEHLLLAAERLDRVHDLGRAIRALVAQAVCDSDQGPMPVFVNLHPLDFDDPELYAASAPLSAVAALVVLEVTERVSLDGIHELPARIRTLRERGFRIAIDDLGAGYAGLSSFAQLEPDIVKLDRSLVHDVHRHDTKRQVVRSMVELCRQLGMEVIGEGIEKPAELRALVSVGCELLQGYLFARPRRQFAAPQWPNVA